VTSRRFLGCSANQAFWIEHPPSSFGSSGIAARFELLVFADAPDRHSSHHTVIKVWRLSGIF
jgi:hypothetical protein